MADEPLDLFAAATPPPGRSGPLDSAYRQRLAGLAEQGVYLGTSSWKYRGWCGLVYDELRYLTRGKFSEAKFNKTCLAEYAEGDLSNFEF